VWVFLWLGALSNLVKLFYLLRSNAFISSPILAPIQLANELEDNGQGSPRPLVFVYLFVGIRPAKHYLGLPVKGFLPYLFRLS
jgi:hypothetical protein